MSKINIENLEQYKDMKEMVGLHSELPPFSYRFWDKEGKKMYNVKEMSFSDGGFVSHIVCVDRSTKEVVMRNVNHGTLIPSTNLYSVDRDEIYGGDLVMCRFLPGLNKIRLVFWDNGWRILGHTPQEFAENCDDYVKVIGNMFETTILYENYLKEMRDKLKL